MLGKLGNKSVKMEREERTNSETSVLTSKASSDWEIF